MNDAAVVALVVGFTAQAAIALGAWIKTQRDIAEVKTDIRWLKSYATHRRRNDHGPKSS